MKRKAFRGHFVFLFLLLLLLLLLLYFAFSCSAVVVFFGYFVYVRIGVSKFRFNEFYQRDSLTKIDCHFVCQWERGDRGEWAAG